MSSSNFASFAPYTPPPDDPTYTSPASKSSARAWFPPSSLNTSYQSGGIPSFDTSVSGGQGAAEENESRQNQWETRYGMRVDVLAAVAYLLGPISALALLIIETQNDYVRFHAYQSALLMTPLVLFRISASILQFAPLLRTMCTILAIVSQFYMAFRAYHDASQNGLAHFQLPVIGSLAEQWLSEE